jgi:hypothetical protein
LGKQVHAKIQTLFPNKDAATKITMLPFRELELVSRDLKGMTENFNRFPRQHNHDI